MEDKTPIPEIAEVVRHWMPDASEDELKVATVKLRRYLAVLYRTVLRMEAKAFPAKSRDKFSINDKVRKSNNND